jgi:hypothetical protein
MNGLSSYHLGALASTAKFGSVGGEALNEGVVKPLLEQGLIQSSQPNPYGQAKYSVTDKGSQLAHNVVLHQGQFHLNQ